MERTRKVDPEAIEWKKVGGGSFHANIGGRLRIIKPNERFFSREDEIPKNFKDVVVPMNPKISAKKEQEKAEEITVANAPRYSLVHRGGGWFNVVSEDGKVQNENALKKEAAEELLKKLS